MFHASIITQLNGLVKHEKPRRVIQTRLGGAQGDISNCDLREGKIR